MMLHVIRWIAIAIGSGAIWLVLSPDRLWFRAYRARDKRRREFVFIHAK